MRFGSGRQVQSPGAKHLRREISWNQPSTDESRQKEKPQTPGGLRLLADSNVPYETVILRGFTCSAFGRIKVTRPCSIVALILPASIDGSSSKLRRKFSRRDSR